MKKTMLTLFILLSLSLILFSNLFYHKHISLSNLLFRTSDCYVLPKNIQYKIVLGDELFLLTDKGLTELGYIKRGIYNTKISTAKKTFYFYNNHDGYINTYFLHKKELIISAQHSTAMPFTRNIDKYSISPGGDFLLYNIDNVNELNNIILLDVRTGIKRVLVKDFNNNHSPAWVNDHEFLYQCFSNKKKNKLCLFNIALLLKKDMYMDGCSPGTVTPDGKKILLTKKGATILYNIQNNSEETISNKKIKIDNALWLPNGEGFIHSESKWQDFADAFENPRGLYYYSLKNKKSIRLMKFFDLKQQGGFIVPAGMRVQLEDTELNKSFPLPLTKNKHIMQLSDSCN